MLRRSSRPPVFLLPLFFAIAWGSAAAQPPPPGDGVGACCFGADGCEILSRDACALQGGSYRGDGSTCEPPVCLIALTPVIGVQPSFLEFGVLCPGQCRDGELALRNLAPDPESQLIINELAITPPFSLVDPPQIPLTIPGDGSIVPVTVRRAAAPRMAP